MTTTAKLPKDATKLADLKANIVHDIPDAQPEAGKVTPGKFKPFDLAAALADPAAVQETAVTPHAGTQPASKRLIVESTLATWLQSAGTGAVKGAGGAAFIPSWNVGDARNPYLVRGSLGGLNGVDKTIGATEKTYVEAILGGGVTPGDLVQANLWAQAQPGCTGLVIPPLEEMIINRITADGLPGEGMHLFTNTSRGFDLRGFSAHQQYTWIRCADNIAPPMSFTQTLNMNGATGGTVTYTVSGKGSATITIAGATNTSVQTAIRAIPGCSTARVVAAGPFVIFNDPTLPASTTFSIGTGSAAGGTPTLTAFATNEYHAILSGVTGQIRLQDFTLHLGTQSQDINGIRVRGGAGSTVLAPTLIFRNIRVIGGKGGGNFPNPGAYETTVVHFYKTTGGRIEHIHVDGQRTSALGVGHTNCVGTAAVPIIERDIESHDNLNSHGATWFECGNMVVDDFVAYNNGTGSGSQSGCGWNVEEPYAPMRFRRVRSHNNSSAALRVLTSQTVPASAQGAPVAAGVLLPPRRDVELTDVIGDGSPYGILVSGTANMPQLSGVVKISGTTDYSSPSTGFEVRHEFDSPGNRKANDVVAESMPRKDAHPNSTLSLVSGTSLIQGLYLPRGVPIGNIRYHGGAAAPTTTTHLWVDVLDEDGNIVAQTVDLAAWNASGTGTTQGRNTLAISKLGDGSSAGGKWFPSWSGLYRFALTWIGTGTAPTVIAGGVGAVLNDPTNEGPAMCGFGATGQTVQRALPGTDSILTAQGTFIYVEARK